MKAMTNAFLVVNETFNYIDGNREVVDERHIRNIMNAMMRHEFIPPIVVDAITKLIVDGQHRYAAAINLWKQGILYELPVIFENFENPLLAAILYNNGSKSWHIQHYINAYAKDDRKSYTILKQFCASHKEISVGKIPNYSAAITIITHTYDTTNVKGGNLVITEDQCIKAETLYNELVILRKLIPFMFDYKIIKSWIKVREEVLNKIDFNSYVQILEKYFIAPASKRVSEWEHALLKVLQQ